MIVREAALAARAQAAAPDYDEEAIKVALWRVVDLALGDIDAPVGITFSGEASEAFADRVANMDGWYVRLTPQDGEPFDAVVVGTGMFEPVDGNTWYDAVRYVPADDAGLPVKGSDPRVVRVSRVHVY